jgi:4'-phosphopantetheinyl transferase superfamily
MISVVSGRAAVRGFEEPRVIAHGRPRRIFCRRVALKPVAIRATRRQKMRARVLCQAERVIVESAIDVVDVARFAGSLERTLGQAERLFTAAERSLWPSSQAARFAAKEALAKALGAPGGCISVAIAKRSRLGEGGTSLGGRGVRMRGGG